VASGTQDEATECTGAGCSQQQIPIAAVIARHSHRESQRIGKELGQSRRSGQTYHHPVAPRLVDPGDTGSCSAAVPTDDARTHAASRVERLLASGAEGPDQIEDGSQRPADQRCEKDKRR
jgi:hypothetical protein